MRIQLALLIVGFFTLAGHVQAVEVCGSGKRVNCIVDGDTLWWRGEKVRILDLDAPEISEPACPAELVAGIAAQGALVELVGASDIRLERDGKDRYGRTLAKVYIGDQNAADALIAAGLARPYADRAIGWC